MITKIFEIRDRATYIPVLATKMASGHKAERYHLRRAGYGEEAPLVAIAPLYDLSRCTYDPYSYGSGDRTFSTAHRHIVKNFDALESGAVVDVEYILGEKPQPKRSEMEG